MMSPIQSWHLGASTQDERQVCVGVGREKLCASLGRDLLLQREVWYGLRLDSPWNVEDTRRDGCRMLQLPPSSKHHDLKSLCHVPMENSRSDEFEEACPITYTSLLHKFSRWPTWQSFSCRQARKDWHCESRH